MWHELLSNSSWHFADPLFCLDSNHMSNITPLCNYNEAEFTWPEQQEELWKRKKRQQLMNFKETQMKCFGNFDIYKVSITFLWQYNT